MKRLILFVAVIALAACAKKDDMAVTDSSSAMAPAMAPMADSAMMADSVRADSIRKADSSMMGMKHDTGTAK